MIVLGVKTMDVCTKSVETSKTMSGGKPVHKVLYWNTMCLLYHGRPNGSTLLGVAYRRHRASCPNSSRQILMTSTTGII